jgi:cytochrome c
MMRKLVLAIALVAAMPVAAQAADAEAGKAVFGKCKACHQIGAGAKNAVGPNLTGVIGRKAGTAEGFNYSEAMKNSGLTWDEATFKEYITDPKKKVPGNKMVFMGLPDAADRDNVTEYLKTAK